MSSFPPAPSAKRHAPATLRNREPIRAVLEQVLPPTGTVLEVGAGSGEHAVHFAAAFPGVVWHPTESSPECIASIDAWAAEAGLPNLCKALNLDVTVDPWPAAIPESVDAIFAANVIHIAPWDVCRHLITGASRHAGDSGRLILYGPFMVDGAHTSPSNAAFDDSLKEMDASFGVRDLVDVTRQAATHGFTLAERIVMPANNLCLIFRKTSASRLR